LIGTIDLNDELAAVLAHRLRTYPPVGVDLAAITFGTPTRQEPERRLATRLVTDERAGTDRSSSGVVTGGPTV
jgi:hypothetical protein